jgi:hypothetical protein
MAKGLLLTALWQHKPEAVISLVNLSAGNEGVSAGFRSAKRLRCDPFRINVPVSVAVAGFEITLQLVWTRNRCVQLDSTGQRSEDMWQ